MQNGMKEGQYYYGRHRSQWGVWVVSKVHSNGMREGDFVRDYPTRDEAVLEVYRRNGWKLRNNDAGEPRQA